MKVSAPQFMSSSAPPAVDAPTPIPDGPADPAAPPPPVEPPKPAVWPEWFTGVDNALLVMALLFAFLMASFAARNTDLFRHLAGGQRLVNGTYSLGSDPFSYTGADRPWVNQSWLFDLTVYAVYSADPTGAVAVVLKAVVFAAAFGVLLWFRRPGQAGWPWAVCIVAGALAASGTAQLRPIVFGMLFCSLLLLLLFRGDWTERRGRTLALVGGLCWLWGGFDSFALVGPLLLLAAAIAGAVQSAFDSPFLTEDGRPAPPPVVPGLFDSPPAHKTLFLAAAVGLLGVLLNPTFVIGVTKSPAAAVAQLIPYELAFGTTSAMAEDEELRLLTYSLLSTDYWWAESLGKNAGSAGLFLLVVIGAVALALGFAELPVALIALWFATLLLGFLHYRFVPLFAVAAVPLVAGLLNAVSVRFPLGTTADPRSKGLLTASRVGRIVTVPLFLALLAVTVPGWLQPQYTDPALARRLEWRIAADEAFVRGVEQVQRWRTSGDLPADVRGLIVHPEFGDYAAWFAPAEPVFANGRYRFHAAEVDDLILVRQALLTRRARRAADAPPPPAPEPAAPVADKYGAAYCVVGRPHSPTDTEAVIRCILDLSAERDNLTALWHLDGRTAVVGRANTVRALALRDKLALDPVRLAFAPQAGLPDGPLEMPLNPDAGWLATVLDRPPPQAAYRDDGATFGQLVRWTTGIEEQKSLPARIGAVAAAGGWARPDRALADAELALPLLVCRAARKAIHQTPDDPIAYAALADAYQSRYLPEYEPRDAARQRLTAAARAAARLTPPDRATPLQLLNATLVWGALFVAQVELGQMDLARESVKELGKVVAASAVAGGVVGNPPGGPAWQTVAMALDRLRPTYQRLTGQDLAPGKDEFEFEEQAKKSGRNEQQSTDALLKKLDRAVAEVVGKMNEEWERATRGAKPGQRGIAAWQMFQPQGLSLPGKALQLIKSCIDGKLSAADAGVRSPVELAFALIAIELEVGKLEEAGDDLAKLEDQLAAGGGDARAAVAELKLTKLRRQGNFKQAIAVLDESRGGRFPKLSDRDKQLAAQPGLVLLGLGAALPPFGAGELLPVFRPPADTRPEALPALVAEFVKVRLDGHPVLGPGNRPRELLLAEAQYYYQRGVLALCDGDMPTAQSCFEQARGPQGVPLEVVLAVTQEVLARGGRQMDFRQIMPSYPLVVQYLRLIAKHRNSPPLP